MPFFLFCGLCASLNILFAPRRGPRSYLDIPLPKPLPASPDIPLTPLPRSRASASGSGASHATANFATADEAMPLVDRKRLPKERRTRVTYSVLVLVVFLASCVGASLVSSIVVGYILAVLFKAGHFNMSTYVASPRAPGGAPADRVLQVGPIHLGANYYGNWCYWVRLLGASPQAWNSLREFSRRLFPSVIDRI